MNNIYIIGGSPCSGKSTTAEILSKKHNLLYFKVDDHLNRYMQLGAERGFPLCKKIVQMTPEQIWMRDPALQCEEEFRIYEEISPFFMAELKASAKDGNVITEGAAYFPKLMKQFGIAENRYISLTPTPEFQVYHFKKREWISYILEGCSDKEAAFDKWMNRDILYAANVRSQCAEMGYVSLVNDGGQPVEAFVKLMEDRFELSPLLRS